MSAKDKLIIKIANQSGISVCLVTKLSRKPAITKKGTVLNTTFRPTFTPFIKDAIRLKVPGNKIPFPTIKPAQAATIITEISIVP